jgi:hypothetical protein
MDNDTGRGDASSHSSNVEPADGSPCVQKMACVRHSRDLALAKDLCAQYYSNCSVQLDTVGSVVCSRDSEDLVQWS